MSVSPEDEKYIAENPLGRILNPFRREFEIFDEATYNENPNSMMILLTNRRSLAAFFADLTEYATKKLSQKSADKLLPGEFSAIHHSIWSHSHDPPRYYPLAAAINKCTSDLEAWKTILQFVEDYAAIPISLPPHCRKLSYESWREYIAALRIELKNNVHGELSGFWDQFFVGKPWEKRASYIYENLCKEHGGDALADFPTEPSKDTMWRWFDKFQKKYLDTRASFPKDEEKTLG
ncbi:serine/threonine-protein kinase Sgk2 [Blumeria hordei DH14]|uniref:Serine/threonine-protein kinase Sgk2 n=1 Tax=Blumeria graminis f. sp. hordei (strain DH14) TaxID=546991 RepID=N1J4Z2_BLUG1|nr:serine/threonine-protein kinase Sgk2 [Blumeria hordei DH14]